MARCNASTAFAHHIPVTPRNAILNGDCIELMRSLERNSVDFNRLHPTQKPVAALTPLVEAFCRPGGLVLDPFCGSGSTLMAARERGRDFLGIELSRTHHRTATDRLANTGRAAA